MKSLHALLASTALLTALLGGCKGKDGDPGPAGPAGPAGPNLTGSIVGFVEVFNEFGVEQPKNGVTVTLENVTPAVTATTDANGRYELTNVRNGTYTLAYSKSGYGLTKVQGYPHAGGDQPAFLYSRTLNAISTTTVTNAVVGPIQGGSSYRYRMLTATLANSNQSSNTGLGARAFVGTSANVTAATGINIGPSGGASSQQADFYLDASFLNQKGLASGTTAYAIIYGSSRYSDDGYYDLATGRFVYTTLNPTGTRVVSFIVP